MKKIAFLSVFVVLLLLSFSSCTDESSIEAITLIPIVGFTDTVESRAAINFDVTGEYNRFAYLSCGPMITKFATNSSYNSENHNSYAMPLGDSEMVVIISRDDETSLIRYYGFMADGSGTLEVTHDPKEGLFSFEQILFVTMSGSSASDQQYAIYAKGDNLSIDKHGAFQGRYVLSYVGTSLNDQGEVQSSEFAVIDGEVFRGEMDGVLGTGLAIYNDLNTDASIGANGYRGAAVDVPGYTLDLTTALAVGNLSDYKAYLSHPSLFELDDANESWAIVTLTDGGDTPEIAASTTLEEGAYTNFLNALPEGWTTTLTNQ